jgi:hypothetical protein
MGDEQMLSAIKLICAGLLALLVIYGLIVIVLKLLLRIKEAFNPPRDYTAPRHRPKVGFLAIVLGALLYLAAVCALEFFPQLVLYALMLLGVSALLFSATVSWGTEDRLKRYLSRPPFIDESHRAVDNGAASDRR